MTVPTGDASRHPLSDGWARLGIGKRAGVAVIAAVLLVNIGLAGLQAVIGGSDPGGPVSSSFSTGADGFGAWADLLAEHGHPVTRLRTPPAQARVDPRSTLVLADPEVLSADDVRAVLRLVRAGGRAVLGGETATPVLAVVAGQPVRWASAGAARAATLVPVDETAGVGRVQPSGRGRYDDVGGLLPIIEGTGTGTGAPRDRVLAVVATIGRGEVVGLADTGMLHNRRLDRADNAALALAVVGDVGRTVVFAESVHGYGATTGLGALPSSWKWAGLFLLLATGLGLWTFGQRFGPPEETSRRLRPPRKDYVDALAADLASVDPAPTIREETHDRSPA